MHLISLKDLVCFILLTGTVCLSDPIKAGQMVEPARISYTITFQTQDRESLLHIVMAFRGGTGATKLYLPNENYGQTLLYKAVRHLKATSLHTAIIDTDKPAVKTLTYDPNRMTTVEYDLVQDWQGDQLRNGNYRRAVLQPTYFACAGATLWVTPAWPQDRPISIRLKWRNLLQNWSLLDGFGRNQRDQRFVASLNELRDDLYFGGDFRIVLASDHGSSLWFALRGDRWRFSDADFASIVRNTDRIEREFWKERRSQFGLQVMLLPTQDEDGVFAGNGYGHSYALFLPQNTSNLAYLKQVVAHERFHGWLPGDMNDLNLPAWFIEGFTDYYANLLLLRAGLITLEEHLHYYNDRLRAYYASDERNRPIEQAEDLRQNYDRGLLLALRWNALIRAAARNGSSLDEVMLRLRANHGHSGKAAILAAMPVAVRSQVQQDIEQFLDAGETIVPLPDSLGPGIELTTLERPTLRRIPQFRLKPGLSAEEYAACLSWLGVKTGRNK